MKVRQKVLAVVLAVMFVLMALVGCGQSGNVNNSVTTNATTATGTQVDTAPIKITVVPQNDNPQDPQSIVTKEIAKKFGLDIEYVYLERTKISELLSLRMASGEIPDWMLLQPTMYQSYSQSKILAEIPIDTFKKFAPKTYEYIPQNSDKNIYEFYKLNEKLFGIPILQVGSNVHHVPIWRDDWLKKVGITKIPETIEEAEAAFYKFRNEDPDGNGKKDTYALSSHGFIAIYGAYGGYPVGADYKEITGGKVGYTATQPEMMQALTLLSKWYKDGLIDPEFITGESKGQYWANSPPFWNSVIGFSAPGVYYHIMNVETINKEILTAGQTPMPVVKGSFLDNLRQASGAKATYHEGMPLKLGANGLPGIRHWSTIAGTAAAFGKNVSRDPRIMERILKMVESFNTDIETMKLLSCGIKDVTWENNPENGLPKVKAPYDTDAIKKAALATGANGVGWPIANFTQYDKLTMTEPVAKYIAKYGSITPNWESAVWMAPPSSAQYKSVLDKKVSENYALFITGQRPLSEWDKFVDDMNKSGLDQTTKEANEWYAKYRAKK